VKKIDKFFIPLIVVLSIVVPVVVAVLMFLPDSMRLEFGGADLRSLPFFHAIINGCTAILLLVGFVFIKNKKIAWHRISMISAFILSSVFLVSYVISKLALSIPSVKFGDADGNKILSDLELMQVGNMRYVYIFILASHILLSISVLPLALLSIYRGITGEYEKHKKLVKWTFPIWIYVAITGVLVYIFMMPYYA
jgi:putative membrane protein